jgi:hypothetical protein
MARTGTQRLPAGAEDNRRSPLLQLVSDGRRKMCQSQLARSGSPSWAERSLPALCEPISVACGHVGDVDARSLPDRLHYGVPEPAGRVEDDSFTVTKLDRLTRSVGDLLEIVARLEVKTVSLRVLSMSGRQTFDTATSTGRLMLSVIAAVGQPEREAMLERQRASRRQSGKADIGAACRPAEIARLKEAGVTPTEIAVRLRSRSLSARHQPPIGDLSCRSEARSNGGH